MYPEGRLGGDDFMDAKQLLDALVGAKSKEGRDEDIGPQRKSLQEMFEALGAGQGGVGGVLGRVFESAAGGLRELAEDTNLMGRSGKVSAPADVPAARRSRISCERRGI
jgi:hypothetical protein